MGKNDQEVVRAVLAGDKDAFGTLVVRHSPRLFRVAFRITGNQADAEDVVQEAVLRGYRKLDGFEARADFGTWIYRIAVRAAVRPGALTPSRCAFLRASLRALRTASAFSRARFSEGFS